MQTNDTTFFPAEVSIPAEEPAKAWLREHFEQRRLSTVSNWAHGAVRSGARLVRDIALMVRQQARVKLNSRWSDDDDRAFAQAVLDALQEDPDGFRLYCEYIVRYEAMTPAARQALKDARSEQHRRRWLESQPASEKQVSYLRALGFRGEVTSKAHASRLIDEMQGGRA